MGFLCARGMPQSLPVQSFGVHGHRTGERRLGARTERQRGATIRGTWIVRRSIDKSCLGGGYKTSADHSKAQCSEKGKGRGRRNRISAPCRPGLLAYLSQEPLNDQLGLLGGRSCTRGRKCWSETCGKIRCLMRARTEVGDVALAGIKSPARPVKALMYCLSPRRSRKAPLVDVFLTSQIGDTTWLS
jgi:hypothetical protein